MHVLVKQKKRKRLTRFQRWLAAYNYTKFYAMNFVVDTLKLVLVWFFILKFLAVLYHGIVIVTFPTFWQNLSFYLTCILLVSYYEIIFWRTPILYGIDFYMFYVIFKLLNYLDRLELLWVHRR